MYGTMTTTSKNSIRKTLLNQHTVNNIVECTSRELDDAPASRHKHEFNRHTTYMAWRNVLPAEKVKQKGAKAINHTFWSYSSYKKDGKPKSPKVENN